MNNGRIWCVVNPTVGLPAFLGSVALISFTVHFAVLNNTTWVGDFFKGKSAAVKKAETPTNPVVLNLDGGSQLTIQLAKGVSGDAAKQVVITLTPEGAVRVAENPPARVAAATSEERR